MTTRSRFVWNPGGWFGALTGCTAWLFVLGLFLWRDDRDVAVLALLGGALLVALGVVLWRRRTTLAAYAAFQIWFAAMTVVVAVVVIVGNATGLATPPPPGHVFADWLPYWTIAIPPALMVFFAASRKHD
jgi:high-affinity Fe2+/Pb2+ permease